MVFLVISPDKVDLGNESSKASQIKVGNVVIPQQEILNVTKISILEAFGQCGLIGYRQQKLLSDIRSPND